MGGDADGGNFADYGAFKNMSNMMDHVSEEESHFEGVDSDSSHDT